MTSSTFRKALVGAVTVAAVVPAATSGPWRPPDGTVVATKLLRQRDGPGRWGRSAFSRRLATTFGPVKRPRAT